MDYQEFTASLERDTPPNLDQPLLLALWHDARGDWERAHDIAQDIDNRNGAWVHAYLHRVEGDNWNANYWYRRAGRAMPDQSLREEWEHLVRALLPR